MILYLKNFQYSNSSPRKGLMYYKKKATNMSAIGSNILFIMSLYRKLRINKRENEMKGLNMSAAKNRSVNAIIIKSVLIIN